MFSKGKLETVSCKILTFGQTDVFKTKKFYKNEQLSVVKFCKGLLTDDKRGSILVKTFHCGLM